MVRQRATTPKPEISAEFWDGDDSSISNENAFADQDDDPDDIDAIDDELKQVDKAKKEPQSKNTVEVRRVSSAKKPAGATKKDYKVLKEVGTAVLEEAFYDLYSHRRRIYRVNFMRGVFFGLGAFIGGTVIIAGVIGLLSLLVQVFPDFSDYIQWLINILSRD